MRFVDGQNELKRTVLCEKSHLNRKELQSNCPELWPFLAFRDVIEMSL